MILQPCYGLIFFFLYDPLPSRRTWNLNLTLFSSLDALIVYNTPCTTRSITREGDVMHSHTEDALAIHAGRATSTPITSRTGVPSHSLIDVQPPRIGS